MRLRCLQAALARSAFDAAACAHQVRRPARLGSPPCLAPPRDARRGATLARRARDLVDPKRHLQQRREQRRVEGTVGAQQPPQSFTK